MSTAEFPGWYVEFQAAVLRQLPRPGEIDQTTAKGWFDNQQVLKEALKRTLCPPQTLQHSDFLRSLSAGQTITIGEIDGTETLAQAKDVFSYINSDFKNWGLDVPSEAKGATTVQVHELMKNGRFDQFFPTLGKLDDLCLTQAQIKKFCRDHKSWLRTDGYATLFLFKVAGQFFVARVCFGGGGRLDVRVFRFSYGCVWGAGFRIRIVVPQL